MSKTPQKRLRINPTHRWSEKETDCLLNAVILELQEDPEAFEKPTSRRFYEKIKWKNPIFSALEWPTMKTRMRHLRNSYNTVMQWKNDPDYDDKEFDGAAHRKSCLFFDQLHEISNLMQTNCNDANESKLRIEKVTEQADWDDDSQSSTSPKGESPTSRPEPEQQSHRIPVLKRKQDSIAVLVAVQEARMKKDEELAKMKIAADEKRWREELELEREKIQLKRYEIESNERVAMAKLKLEKEEALLRIDMEERVKRYELELRQQNDSMMQI